MIRKKPQNTISVNSWVADLMLKQVQSFLQNDGCITSVLAIVVLGFHQDSIVCISCDEWWWGATRGTSRGKNNYWAYFLPKSFTHQQSQQKVLFPCIVIMKWKMGGRSEQRQAVCCIYLSFVSFWTGMDIVQFETHRWYQFLSPPGPLALCCRWMCCTVSALCNLATCLLLDTERNTACFRCNGFESRAN